MTTTRSLRRPLELPLVADAAERVLLGAASRLRVGQLTIVLPDGRRRVFGDAGSDRRGEIVIHDRAAMVRLLVDGETGAGEAYMDGQWSSPDLAALLLLAALNRQELSLVGGWVMDMLHDARTSAERLALTDDHVFVCARSVKGNGYDVYRCDFDFQTAIPSARRAYGARWPPLPSRSSRCWRFRCSQVPARSAP